MTVRDGVASFFQKVVVEYNCGDIRILLRARLDVAGPLLACVVNGIDMLGGMKHGFHAKSCHRSKEFMKEYMHLSEEHAALLYRAVRCGIAHEGVPKPGIRFFVCDEPVDSGTYFYRGQDDMVWLNVTELCRQYLAVVEAIAERPSDHLSHVPPADQMSNRLFLRASVGKSIDDFCDLLAARVNEKVERGEIHVSASPFLPELLSGYTVRDDYSRPGRK